MIVVYRTGYNTRHDTFELVQLYWKFLALSKRCNVACNLLTNNYVCSREVVLSITRSEIYLVQFNTLHIYLQRMILIWLLHVE